MLRLFMPLCLLISISSTAQSTKEEEKQAQYEQLKALIDSRHYTFNAQSATAVGGKSRQLTSLYTISVSGDSLNVNLPYYGVAYSANPGDTNGGISFSSTSFTYEVLNTKKGDWFIVITPKNEKNASKIQLSITTSGYATVQITSNYRQLISFYGTIIPNSKNN
jgi:hypothetical protein